jgi:hypothetical protein
MKLKFKDVIIAVLLLVVLILMYAFYDERRRGQLKDRAINKLLKDNERLSKQNFDLLQRFIILENQNVPDVLKELEFLKDTFANIVEYKYSEGIGRVINQLENGNHSSAVLHICKIIESLILAKISENKKNQYYKSGFQRLIDYAVTQKMISVQEKSYSSLLREIRNTEGHQIDSNIEKRTAGLAIFSGIEIIYKLSCLTNQQLTNHVEAIEIK